MTFQSQGRFFGGCCPILCYFFYLPVYVSIAGAILWGVLPDLPKLRPRPQRQFQSQGRFFGGCCAKALYQVILTSYVSIAGAILWGVLRKGILQELYCQWEVSIAGAILWGVLLCYPIFRCNSLAVSIAGAILWGVLQF